MFSSKSAIAKTLFVVTSTACALPGSAGVFTDSGDAGGTFGTPDNMAIYASKFEVQYDQFAYDGDGGTFEDDKALGTITYDSSNPILGLPADEEFIEITMNTYAWNGRATFDSQTLEDIFTVEISDNGVDFTPIALNFSGALPADENNVASASGFSAQYVRVGLLARLESSGNQDQNVWSSQIFDITLTSAPIPEPGSLALVGMGGLALVARRRRS